MPSAASLLSAEDKAKVKKAIPTSSSTNKIITAAVARVYQAREGSRAWSFTGAEGALTFCADKAKGGLWFRVVELSVSGSPSLVQTYTQPTERDIFTCSQRAKLITAVVRRCDMGARTAQRDRIQPGQAILPLMAR